MPAFSRFAALATLPLLLMPRSAPAHFILQAPASWREQGTYGDPQKLGPCGDDADPAARTGIVTAFSPGETITITIDEAVHHPGHYRVALAPNDRSELPAEPPVTPDQSSDCGSVPIMNPPAFPILADGMLQHTEPFGDPQSFAVTLPSDVTCDHCTLQVIEFMSSHGKPCFYHHCADVSIRAGATPPTGCRSDADCADDGACTTDSCNTTTKACESKATTLADVRAGFLGDVGAPECADAKVPKSVGALFTRAAKLVDRAARNPAKAERILGKAVKRLRSASKKAGKASPRKVSTACARALGAALGRAQGRVDCLLSSL
jgi:hypothetical protein